MATTMTVLAVFIASCRMCSASMDCSVPTASDIANVITDIIEDSPAISVVELRPLCLAHGRLRGSYRYVSVLVKYTCSGSSHCPTQSPAVEQFESQCIEGAWSNTVAYSTNNTRTANPTANFSTIARNDCSVCLSQELIDASPYPFTTHTSTHCVGGYFLQ